MKKLIALLLAMLMVVGLFAGCAEQPEQTQGTQATEGNKPTEGESTEPSAEQKEPVELSVWLFEDPIIRQVNEPFFEYIEEKYDWITINANWLPFDAGPEMMSVAFATKDVPDVILDGYGRLSQGVDAGLAYPITDVVDALVEDGVLLSYPTEGVIDGERYYVNTGALGAYSISVNMDIAEEIGCLEYFPEDGLSWSHEDFLTCCRMAKEAGYLGCDLWAGSQSSDMWYYSWFTANGVELTDGGKITRTTFNDPEYQAKALEVLNVFKTMVDEGLCQPGAATMIDQESQPIWWTGTMLFCHGAFSNTNTWKNALEDGTSVVDNFMMFGIPSADGKGGPSASFSSSGVAMFDSNDGKNVEAAKIFLDEMFRAESGYMQRSVDLAGGSPAPRVSHTEHVVTDPDYQKINVEIGNPYSLTARADWGPAKGWYADFRLTFFPLLSDFYAGNITAEQLLADWETAANAVIANYEG